MGSIKGKDKFRERKRPEWGNLIVEWRTRAGGSDGSDTSSVMEGEI